MVICTLLIIFWFLYSFALLIGLWYLAELPPTPLFDINSLGLCSGFVLAISGWIAYTLFAARYIFGG